ncbi:hypothetical protein [[Clostridium] hylemonae]|uniref:hypothetical protein n=1 Tax=[Clostridium] hylemonae TaxID=89153 RepID=UPI0011C9B67D|nr:hypothetical protein [[Clostridium] hylemonae]
MTCHCRCAQNENALGLLTELSATVEVSRSGPGQNGGRDSQRATVCLNNYASLEEAVYNRTMQPYSAIINLTITGQTDGGTWTTTDRNYYKSNVPKVAIIFIRRRKLYPPDFFALFR